MKLIFKKNYLLILCLFISCCSKDRFEELKEKEELEEQHDDLSLAIKSLPRYYSFIKDLTKKGYVFQNFNHLVHYNFEVATNTIVLRHDIHYRDIKKARHMMVIEKELLGVGSATYFVQYNDPKENSSYDEAYLSFIEDCSDMGFDVQPHISINDLIIDTGINSYWSKSYSLSELKSIFNTNYLINSNDVNKDIVIINKDVFELDDLFEDLKKILIRYNDIWETKTGIAVEGYASHGSSSPMNNVINNAVMLDLIELESSGIYAYDTYNTKVFNELEYYSDNSMPNWMYHATLVNHTKIEMLVHPYLWQ